MTDTDTDTKFFYDDVKLSCGLGCVRSAESNIDEAESRRVVL